MLFNQTTQKKIIDSVHVADSAWKKFRGLMFEKKKRFDYVLIFDFGRETTWGASIHMLFVFFPISLVYLNEKKYVVDIKQSIQPWTVNYTPKKQARYLVELPPENGKKISLGDELNWK